MDHIIIIIEEWRLHAIFSDPRVWIKGGSTVDQHGSTWINRLQHVAFSMSPASCVMRPASDSWLMRPASDSWLMRHASCVMRPASGVRRHGSCVRLMVHASCVMRPASDSWLMRHASGVMRQTHGSCVRRPASDSTSIQPIQHHSAAARCRS